jgi:hypothetical protein
LSGRDSRLQRRAAMIASLVAGAVGLRIWTDRAIGDVAFAAATPPPPSRLETVLWWLPALSIVTVCLMVLLELAQSLPRWRRVRRMSNGFVSPVAITAVIVVLLNLVRAADIVGFF